MQNFRIITIKIRKNEFNVIIAMDLLHENLQLLDFVVVRKPIFVTIGNWLSV